MNRGAGRGQWLLLAALVVLLGAAIRLLGLGNTDLWGDEAFSVITALGSLRSLVESLTTGEPHPPFYPVLLAVWLRAFGRAEVIARLPSAFVGIASIPVAMRLAAAFAADDDQRRRQVVALAAGLLVALNPFQVWYSQEARMYAQVSFFAGLASLALVRLWQGRPGGVWTYALAALGAAGSHYYGLFVPVAHGLATAIVSRGDPTIRLRWLRGVGLAALLYLPWVVVARRIFVGYYAAQPGTVDLLGVAISAWVRVAAGWSLSWRLAVVAAAALTVLALAGALLPARSTTDARIRALLIAWLATPYVGGLIVSLVRPMFAERYLIVSSLPFILLVARATTSPLARSGFTIKPRSGPRRGQKIRGVLRGLAVSPGRRARLGAALAAATFLAAVALALGPLANVWAGRYIKSTYHTHVRDVDALLQPGDAVILDGTSQLPLYTYYLPHPWPTYPLPRTLPLDLTATTAELEQISQSHHGAWVFLYATPDYDPGDAIPRWLTAHAYRGFDDWAVTGRLQYYRFAPEGSLASVATRLRFGNALGLEQYRWSAAPIVAGDSVPVGFHWRQLADPVARPRVALRLVDAAGFTWAQSDQFVGGDFEPTVPWTGDGTLDDRHALLVPPGTPPGEYRLLLNVYGADDPTPLAATGDGAPVGPGGVLLGQVRVAAAARTIWTAGIAGFHPTTATFGSSLALLGYAGSEEVAAGQSGYLTLIWKVLGPQAAKEQIRLALVGRDGVVQERDLSIASAAYPSAQWQPGDVLREQYHLPIGERLPAGSYRLDLRLLAEPVSPTVVSLGSIRVIPGPTPVPVGTPQHPLNATLGNAIALEGFDLSPTRMHPGGSIHLRLYWKDLEPLQTDYTVFVHLLNGAEQVVTQRDQPPAEGRRPTSSWFPGDVVADDYLLVIPDGTASGEYPIEVGMYNPSDGRRLPIAGAGPGSGDRVILARLQVAQ